MSTSKILLEKLYAKTEVQFPKKEELFFLHCLLSLLPGADQQLALELGSAMHSLPGFVLYKPLE